MKAKQKMPKEGKGLKGKARSRPKGLKGKPGKRSMLGKIQHRDHTKADSVKLECKITILKDERVPVEHQRRERDLDSLSLPFQKTGGRLLGNQPRTCDITGIEVYRRSPTWFQHRQYHRYCARTIVPPEDV